jgi:hypothetical protein
VGRDSKRGNTDKYSNDPTQLVTGDCPTTGISPTESHIVTPTQEDGHTLHSAEWADNADSGDRVPKGNMVSADWEIPHMMVSPTEGPKQKGKALEDMNNRVWGQTGWEQNHRCRIGTYRR